MAGTGSIHLHHVIAGVSHLAGHETAPDQLIQAVLLLSQVVFDGLRVQLHIAGTDGLMGVLSPLLLAEAARRTGIIGCSVAGEDQLLCCRQGLLGKAQGVGTHIGDETDGPLAGDVHALIELLGDGHGAARRHIQLPRGLLLQGGGDKGRRRRAALFRTLDVLNGKRAVADVGDDAVRFLLRVKLPLLAVAVVTGGEAAGLVQAAQGYIQGPELLGLEILNLPLPFHHQARCHRLDTSCGKTAPDLFPQQRAELIAHDAVQDTPRLLGIHQVIVDVPGLFDAPLDDVFRNFVKGDALGLAVWQIQKLLQMPGDGLALPVRVRCQIDAVGFLRRRAQ